MAKNSFLLEVNFNYWLSKTNVAVSEQMMKQYVGIKKPFSLQKKVFKPWENLVLC